MDLTPFPTCDEGVFAFSVSKQIEHFACLW